MEVKKVKIDSLRPYEKNTKKHTDKQVDAVANSIQQFGFVQPIVIDQENVIVIGHCRYLAAKKLGIEEVPCVAIDSLTPEQIKALRIIDNKTNESEWDFNVLSDELTLLIDDFDFTNFGYNEGEILSLTVEDSVDDEEDDFDMDIEGLEKTAQSQLNKRLIICYRTEEELEKLREALGIPQKLNFDFHTNIVMISEMFKTEEE